MKKRVHERVPATLDAELVFGDIKQPVVIGNFSRKGMYVITTHSDIIRESTPGTEFQLIFHLPSGKTVTLLGIKRWSHKTSLRALTKSLGLELIHPPREYITYVENLENRPR